MKKQTRLWKMLKEHVFAIRIFTMVIILKLFTLAPGFGQAVEVMWFKNLGDSIDYNTDYLTNQWEASIIGFKAAGGDIYENSPRTSSENLIKVYMEAVGGTWHIRADFRTHIEGKTKSHEDWSVQVMFVAKGLTKSSGITPAANGYVGIGITNPTRKLDVGGFGKFRDFHHNSDPQNYLMLGHGGVNGFLDHHGAGNLDFRHENSNLMTLTQTGKLGIGTTSPRQKLHVEGNVYASGRLGIGTTNPTEKLDVAGTVKAKRVILDIGSFPDYVFADDYKLMSLSEIASFIQQNKHLPNMPTEAEVLEKGMDVGQVNTLLVEKVEELTLHTITQQKYISNLEERLERLEKTLSTLQHK